MAKSILLTLFKAAALAGAVYLGYHGESALLNGSLRDGSLWFLGSAALIIAVFRPAGDLGGPSWTPPAAPQGEAPFGLRAILPFLFIAISLFCFFGSLAPGVGWIFLGLALLSAALADGTSPFAPIRAVARFVRGEPLTAGFLAALTAAALFLRIYRLSEFPPGLWFDEANIGITALKILTLPKYMPIFFGEGLEQPGLHFMTVAGFVSMLGSTIFALRLPSAIVGAAAVIPMYFLAAQLFKKRQVAVLASIFLCCSGWHLNFSRWSANAIYSNFFDLLSITCLVWGFRTNRRMFFVWAGLSLGIGLNFYHASRTWALFIAGISALWLLRSKFSGRQFVNLCSAAVATLIIVAPLIEFSLEWPEVFYKHTSELNVFKTTEAGNTDNAIVSNARLHLLMFNYSGDAMTRHNAPAEPVLEYITGTAFALGLALAVLCVFRFEFALILLGMTCALLGGILSKPVDLPTSLRTIDCSIFVNIVAAFAFCSATSAFASFTRSLLLKRVIVWSTVAAAAFVTSYRSVEKFSRHMLMDETWVGFNGPHRAIAEHLAKTGLQGSQVYLPEIYIGQPTLLFLAKNAETFLPFNDNLLPFERVHDFFVCRDRFDSTAKLESMYPNASRLEVAAPYGDHSVLAICFDIRRKDVEESFGVSTLEYPEAEFSGEPTLSVDHRFSRTGGGARTGDSGLVQRAAIKVITPGTLKLSLTSEGGTTVLFQDDQVLSGNGVTEFPLPVGTFVVETRTKIPAGTAGDYTLNLELRGANGQDLPLPLFRSPPVISGGLLGQYFKGMLWEGEPQLTRVDPAVDFYFHLHPVPQPNSILWQGDILIPESGTYRFRATAVDYIQVYIDGALALADRTPTSDPAVSMPLRLTKGKHQIVVAYASESGYAGVELSWEVKDQASKIPWNYFLPRDLKFDRARLREDASRFRAANK